MSETIGALKCAIYCRYSSEGQRSGLSIEAQRRACEDYAKKQGWQIYKIYVDEARSGGSDKREAFQRMIGEAMATLPTFQVVLVHKSDRFARNREDAVKYKAILKRQKIRFVSATEPIGSGDVTEVLLESMLDGIAEFYSLQLSQRTLAGMAEAARNGWSSGVAPYGYKHVEIETPKGPKKKLVVDAAKARVVRRVFSLYLQGDGVQTIRQKMEKRGYRFTKNFLLWMLRNQKYAGDMVFGKSPKKTAKTSIEPVVVKDTHEAIVEREAWERAQEILDGKISELRIVPSEYLLSGILKCQCGGAMVGHSAHGNGGRFRYYSCGKVLRSGRKACAQAPVSADRMEEQIFEAIQEYLTDEENVLSLIQANNEALERLKKGHSRDAGGLKSEIARKDAAAKNLLQAIEGGQGLNLGHVATRLEEIAREKGEIEARIRHLETSQARYPVGADDADSFVAYLKDLFLSGLIRNKTLFQGLVQEIRMEEGGQAARVAYNPNFHPQADVLTLKKKHSCGHLKADGSHECDLAPQIVPHANLLGEQIVRLDFTPRRRRRILETRP